MDFFLLNQAILCVTSIDPIYFFLQCDGISGGANAKQPFYLHPPTASDSGEDITTSKIPKNQSKKPPLRRSINNAGQQQPNLDARLRQYSAYELNRKPKKRSSLKSSQNTPNSVENSQNLSSTSTGEDSLSLIHI